MTAKVVDASAVVAFLFKEPSGDSIPARLHGFDLYAPELLPFEVANACLKKIRAEPDQSEALLTAFALLPSFSIALAEIDMLESITLAVNAKLSLYDASYLWLASQLGCELVTLDGDLRKAAAKL